MVDKSYHTKFTVNLDHGESIAKHGGLKELLRDHHLAGLVYITVLAPNFYGGQSFGELGSVVKLGLDNEFTIVIDKTSLGIASLGHYHCCQPIGKGECG